MLQGYYWNLPGIFKSMTVAGISNNWDASQNNMTLINESEWEYIHDFTPSTSGVEFKFTANGNWGINWGDDNQSATNLPITYKQASQGSSYNIAIPGTVSGYIRFRFNTSSSRYSIEQVASGNTTEVSNNSTNFWYKNLSAKTQNGDLDRFTMIWMPPPQKSSSGLQSVGYDPFDYYDLGTYNEKGSVETRYGSEAQLNTCIDSLRSRRIQPIIDLVLNHNQNGESGTNQFKFAFANHNTFEKLDPSGNNSNDYFNASLANQPFHHEYDFGRDVNFEHPYQRQGLKAWGDWVTAKAAYQGYRWDVAYNIDPWFISEFMNDGLKKGRFSVLEFWEKESEGTTGEIETYLALTDYRSAMFDMPLRHSLEDLCENPGADFDISTLAEKGLVNHAPQWAVTFAESHDTIRPYGPENPPKVGIIKDKMMAYAFVLISEGLPMISYNDYFIGWKADQSPPDDSVDDGWTGGTLKTEIDKLIDIRRQFTGGDTTYLNSDSDLLIMKRSGGNKPGCILTLNDDDDYTKSASVNTGWPEDTVLADALATNHTVTVLSGGMATLEAPSRGYRIYVNQDDL